MIKQTLARRVFSVFLTLCMTIGLFTGFPLTAHAAAVHEAWDAFGFSVMMKAVTVMDGDTVKLCADITVNSDVQITDKLLTIDLNGFDLTIKSDKTDKAALTVTDSVVTLAGKGTFSVISSGNDGLEANNSTITVTTVTTSAKDCHAVEALEKSKVTVLKNAMNTGEVTDSFAGSIFAVSAKSGSTVKVNGNVESEKSSGVFADGAGSIIEVKGNVACKDGVGAKAIKGGVIKVGGDVTGNTGGGAEGKGSKTTVVGDVITSDGGVHAYQEGNVTVYGNIHTAGDGVNTSGKCKVTVIGSVMSSGNRGIFIQGASTVSVGGDITSPYCGIHVNSEGGCNVHVGGNIYRKPGASLYLPGVMVGVAYNYPASTVTVDGSIFHTNEANESMYFVVDNTYYAAGYANDCVSYVGSEDGYRVYKAYRSDRPHLNYQSVIKVKGQPFRHSLSIESSTGGYVNNGDSGLYPPGYIVDIAAIAYPGWEFVGWESKAGWTTVPGQIANTKAKMTTLTMPPDGDVVVTAVFKSIYEPEEEEPGESGGEIESGSGTVSYKIEMTEWNAVRQRDIYCHFRNMAEALEYIHQYTAPGDTRTLTLLYDCYDKEMLNIDNRHVILDLNGKDLHVTNKSGVGLFVSNGGSFDYTGAGSVNVTGLTYGVYAAAGGTAVVTNAEATDTTGTAVYSVGTGSRAHIKNDATAPGQYGIGVHADGGTALVGGDARASHIGVLTEGLSGSATVNGEVVTTGYNGDESAGISARGGGTAVVDGGITAANYIRIDTSIKTKPENVTPTTKTGYFTYTDGTSSVWVRDPSSPICEMDGTQYNTLTEALGAIQIGETKTIKLLINTTHKSGVIVDNKNITFDLNGYKLNIVTTGSIALHVTNNGSVDMTGEGELNLTGADLGAYISQGGRLKATIASSMGNFSAGIFASGAGVSVTLTGSATGGGMNSTGAVCQDGAVMTIHGDSISTAVGAKANDAELIVKGDAIATEAGGVGAQANTSGYGFSGKLTVEGKIIGASFAKLENNIIEITSAVDTTTKPGYRTYTDGINSIWVKETLPIGAPVITSANSYTCEQGTAGNFELTATGTEPITWSASGGTKPADVTVTGSTLNVPPTVGAGTYYFTITAGNETAQGATQIFTLTVFSADSLDVETDAAALTWDSIKGANTWEDEVTSDLSLPTSGANGTDISWSSDNAAVSDTGAVTRPAFGLGNSNVELTATVSKNGASDTVIFYLTVLELEMTDDQAVAAAKLAITWDSIKNTNTSEDNVTANLVSLPVYGAYDVSVNWVSTSPAALDVTGEVTRPDNGAGDVPVTLTAMLEKNGASDAVAFTLTIKELPAGLTDVYAVAEDTAALTFESIRGKNATPNDITDDFSRLPVSGADGSNISWSSDDPDTVSNSGVVTRPAYGSGDKTVTLTATVTKGSEIETVDFILTVKELPMSDVQKVALDAAALTWDSIKGSNSAENNVIADLIDLPIAGANGSKIRWSSDNTAVLKTGAVSRPAYGSGDASVTLTATVTSGVESDSVVFNLTVKEAPKGDVQKVAEDKAALTFDGIKGSNTAQNNIVGNLSLPPSGSAGSTIRWSSDTPGIISNAGVVNRPAYGSGDRTVILTATIENGSASDTVIFTLIVKERESGGNNNPGGNPSPGGGGGTVTPVQAKPVIDQNGVKLDPAKLDTTKPSYTIDIKAEDIKNGSAYVAIPSSVLTELSGKNPSFILEIKTPYGSYKVPVNLASMIPGLSDMLTKNNLKAEDISFKVVLTDKSADKDITAAIKAGFPKGKVIGSVVDFTVEIVNTKTGKAIGGANVFASAVTRLIPIPADTKFPKYWGAFRYNAVSKGFEFVPHATTVIEGVTYVVIKSKTNSVYLVMENNVSFTDTKNGAWYFEYVSKAAAKGLVYGVGNGLYQPDREVTRAEFVQMIVNSMQLPAVKTGTKSYSDVSADAWYYSAIMKARSAGLLDKFGDSGFKPNQPITREEMTSILAKILLEEKIVKGAYAYNLAGTFADFDQMGEAYTNDIMVVTVSGLMVGVGNDRFDPRGVTTRTQAATVQIRLLEILGMIDR